MANQAAQSTGIMRGYANSAFHEPYDEKAAFEQMLRGVTGMTSDEKRERFGVYLDDIIQADIRALRSVSESSKARMTRDALVERHYSREIASLLKRIAGLG